MLYLICIIPIILYLLLIKGMDGFSLGSVKKMLAYFGWGCICCVGLFLLGSTISSDTLWLAPLLEEVLKALPLAIAVYRKKIAFFAETLIYGAAIGAGFALPENILYIYYSTDFLIGDAIVRGFGTALLHMGCTALCGSSLLLGSRYVMQRALPSKVVAVLGGLVPSFLIHCLYNMFLLPELIQMAITIAVLLGLFMLIYAFDNRKIHDWLDLCINNDMMLLKAMREGHLSGTSAGEYLIATRDRFKPEVFFDICMYLGLYLELSIAAKSRMILKEAEMDLPIPDDVHKENMDKLTELHALEKNIGVSGLSVLHPIINTKAMDNWVLDSLL
jgi:Predicted membrane protein